MIKKLLTLAISFFSIAQSLQAQTLPRPKLVVGIVVDQMRWDYLYRYYNRYGENGFKRLMNQGFECKRTQIHYLPTFTAPGHASIYTGSAPALHGIVANDWTEKIGGAGMYCTEDKTVQPVGSSNKRAGQMSPKNLLATTITDELRLATNLKSRVYAFSIKDRGSILPGGHTANQAYWYDDKQGYFISSSFYGPSLPQWLDDFNNRKVSDSLMAIDWNTLYPIETYTQSLSDNNTYEGKFKGYDKPVFPYKGLVQKEYGDLRKRPAGNSYVLMAAKNCITAEALGQKGNTDFLCVSLSTPDYIGHMFGPNAIEVEDTYLRLDKEMAELLSFLDAKIGRNQYTVFLTADHGGAHNANFLKDQKIPAGFAIEKPMIKKLNDLLKTNTGCDSLVANLNNYQVHFNEKKMQTCKKSRAEVKTIVVNYLNNEVEEVAFAIDMENMQPIPEPLKTMVVNGYMPKRSGDIQIILQPGWYDGYASTGTTHGSWNPYDSHIPLLFYGWGIQKGSTHRTVYMKDIAPTLAALLHIQEPNANIGQVISEALKK